ncbi:nitroreductase family protein [Syntrophomonas palmitatica]|uniref:nitroreductase family protein n=1 Tax=Syntrophomonas palmitatica TaxID=402877 RepID=UPI0006CF24DE|nr:nitroreductase family protein [Syntrophomonas palmitatica]
MDCIQAIMTRRSIRAFTNETVKEDDLNIILEAGRMAPTAGNLQPCHFVVVNDPEVRARLQQAAFGQELLSTAQVVIVVCVEPERSSKYGERGMNYYCFLDGANATENMLLAAHALGYGACYMGGFSDSAVKKALNLPENIKVVSMIPLGKAAEQPPVPPKRPLDEIVHKDRW